jgi:hypothetical protein
MSEPTTDEMIAWCEARDNEIADCHWRSGGGICDYLPKPLSLEDAAMLRAIAARLRAPPAAGLAYEPPRYEAAPGNVAMPVFGRKDEER